MKSISFILLAILFFNYKSSIAQVSTNFNNENIILAQGRYERNYSTSIDFEVPSKNIDSLLSREKEDLAKSTELKPLKIAIPTKVDLDIPKMTNWIFDNEFAYGKFTLKLSGALSSSINFDKFYLPKNSELFVYNENGKMITGPVTERENNIGQIWGSWVYQGELITIEIKTPINSMKELILHSDNVAYGYKEVYKSIKVGGFGTSGPCNINVICPLGNGWEGERNSVSTILSANGAEFCTGSLVMNTCGTNVPYYLTANHCFNGNSNVGGWRFAFQAWSTTCPNPGVNTNGVIYNGATLKARNAQSDFCLVELNQIPPTNSGLNYAGWNRSATPAQNATGIHHPSGDLMKISRADNPVTVASAFGTTNQHWRANWSQQNNGAGQIVTAITEGGSSGSPLFDQDHRIIGQLHGGPSFCGSSQPWDFYGRFDLSWTGGGTNATRLSNWLDPTNSGAITTNTTNVANLDLPITFLQITGADVLCGSSSSYSLNVPSGTSITWQLSNPNIASISPTGNSATLNRIFDGVVTITATVSSCGSNISTTKEVVMGSPQIDLVNFTNEVGGQGYWCSTHYNNLFSIEPEYLNGAVFEARLLNYPSMTLFRENSVATTGTDPFGYVPSGWYILQLRTTNSCGTSTWYETEIEYVDCFNYGRVVQDFRVTASPNPTDGELKVTIDKEKAEVKALGKTERVTYQLYNFNRTSIVKQWSFENSQNQQKLNVHGLQAGQYVLVVTKGKFRQSTQIIIR